MIFLFLADGFEEIEALAVVDILRRADLDVRMVGVNTLSPKGAHGIPVQADVVDTELLFDDMQAVVLPGGMPGTLNLEASPIVQKAVSYAVDKGIPVAAICAAPSILGHGDYLNGIEATCYPGFEKDLTGAVISDKRVVTDGLFTTASGAGVAVDFALELVSRLVSPTTAKSIREAIQCP